MNDTLKRIDEQVKTNPVVIYMKGTPQLPSCGFSSRAAQALISTGEAFAYVNVIADPEVFDHLPEYADWPTFPQIYVGGEFIGGGDIVVEMAEKDELKAVLKEAHAKHDQSNAASNEES